MKKEELPEIVIRALEYTVINMGQLTKQEINTLNRYVNKGILMKIMDYNTYPLPKWRYIRNYM